MKKVYNYRKIDKAFLKWLKDRTHRDLTGLSLLYPREEKDLPPQFWRFKLEGITNRVYNDRTNSMFARMIPELRVLFGDKLVRGCVEVGDSTLILDFKSEEDIFTNIPLGKYGELSLHREKLPKTETPLEIFPL